MKTILAVLILAVVLASGCISPDDNPDQPDITGSAILQPEIDSSWTLIHKQEKLIEFPSDVRKDLLGKGVVEASTWEYKKEDGIIVANYVKYASEEDLLKDYAFSSPLIYRGPISYLTIGDSGSVGIYKQLNGPNPLLAHVTKGTNMYYVFYFNQPEGYNSTNRISDTKLLVDILRDMLD